MCDGEVVFDVIMCWCIVRCGDDFGGLVICFVGFGSLGGGV